MSVSDQTMSEFLKKISIFKSKILFLIIILIASFWYFNDYKNHIFFVDEHEFLRKSYYFDLLFVKHDLKDKRWYSEEYEAGAAQPKVGLYIYGLALHLAGIKDIEKTFQTTGFNSIKVNGEFWWQSLSGEKPSAFPATLSSCLKIIWIGRVTGIIFTIGSIGLIFIIGSKIFNTIYGFIGALLFTFNYLMSIEGQNAMTDSMQLFFFLVNLVLCIYWISSVNTRNTKKIIIYSLLIGVNAALGLGTKASALMLPLYLSIFIFLVLLIERSFHRNLRQVLYGAVTIGITMITFFYLLHPFIHQNSIYNSWYMFHSRLENAKTQYWFESPESAIYNRKNALIAIFSHTLAPDGIYTNFYNRTYPVDLFLFMVGLFLMIRQAVHSISLTHKIDSKYLLPLWTFVVFGSLTYYLMNDWGRYYLPFVCCLTLAETYVISIGVKFVWKDVRKFINI